MTPWLRYLIAFVVGCHGFTYIPYGGYVVPTLKEWRGSSWLLGAALTDGRLKASNVLSVEAFSGIKGADIEAAECRASLSALGEPGSGGRTMVPVSSIQMFCGMLVTPKRASKRCVSSTSDWTTSFNDAPPHLAGFLAARAGMIHP